MELIKNLSRNFGINLSNSEAEIDNSSRSETSTKKSTLNKNSLAYLVYKNRKQKGLIKNEGNECPTLYFGDEWAI